MCDLDDAKQWISNWCVLKRTVFGMNHIYKCHFHRTIKRSAEYEDKKLRNIHIFDLQAFSESQAKTVKFESRSEWRRQQRELMLYEHSTRYTTRSARILLSIFFSLRSKAKNENSYFFLFACVCLCVRMCDAVVWCALVSVSVCACVQSTSRKLTQCARTIFHIKYQRFLFFFLYRFLCRSSEPICLSVVLSYQPNGGGVNWKNANQPEKRLLFICNARFVRANDKNRMSVSNGWKENGSNAKRKI